MPQDTYVNPATGIQASGTTWAQLKTGGLKLVLDKLAAANAVKADPATQATVVATGGGAAGGNLPAGNYFVSYSFVDPFGETLAGGRSTQWTISAGNVPRVTIPALPTGCQEARIYLTPAGGAAGSEVLYATGVTTTTFDLSYAAKTDAPANTPPVNTTGAVGLNNNAANPALAIANGNPEVFIMAMSQFASSVLGGVPAQEREIRHVLTYAAGYPALWAQSWAEVASLMWTNLGTVGFTVPTSGVGIATQRRTLA